MNITLYAASSASLPQTYYQAAQELGAQIARRGHTLINGAGCSGLMSAATDACRREGGRTVGVIPQFMIEQNWQHTQMDELIVTPDMHARKQIMAQRADACIALPGGPGTLEELLEIITWKQLGLYDRPIVLLNTNRFFEPLLELLQRCVEEQFMRPLHAQLWSVADDAGQALHLCENTPLWDSSLSKLAAL